MSMTWTEFIGVSEPNAHLSLPINKAQYEAIQADARQIKIDPQSNHPESDALWQPELLAVPSPHYTYTFADNYREDEYKFACGMEERCKEAIAAYETVKSHMHKYEAILITLLNELDDKADGAPDSSDVAQFANRLSGIYNGLMLGEVQTLKMKHHELTLERESLKEQLKKCEKSHKDLYDEAAGYLMAIGNKNIENQSLIIQRKLDTECIESLQRKGAENEVKIEEQVAQMAVTKQLILKSCDELSSGVWKLEVSARLRAHVVTNTPLAAKDLLERVERMENELVDLRNFKVGALKSMERHGKPTTDW